MYSSFTFSTNISFESLCYFIFCFLTFDEQIMYFYLTFRLLQLELRIDHLN